MDTLLRIHTCTHTHSHTHTHALVLITLGKCIVPAYANIVNTSQLQHADRQTDRQRSQCINSTNHYNTVNTFQLSHNDMDVTDVRTHPRLILSYNSI